MESLSDPESDWYGLLLLDLALLGLRLGRVQSELGVLEDLGDLAGLGDLDLVGLGDLGGPQTTTPLLTLHSFIMFSSMAANSSLVGSSSRFRSEGNR